MGFGGFGFSGGGRIGNNGLSLRASSSSFLSSASPGAVIASLVDPYGSGSTFSTVGAVPGQLALSGGNIVAGATSGAPGTNYSVTIRAAKGGRAIEEPFSFACLVAPPTNTVAPVITGTAQEGQVLTVSNGTWTGAPTAFAYQWYANGVPIAGAINSTRIMTSAEIGKVITCSVTASNYAYGAVATTAATSAVISAAQPVPVNTVAPTASGTGAVGSTLTATSGTWTNSPTSYTYQWRRNGVNIAGATASTYVVVSADVNTTLTCRVSAVNAGGEGAPFITSGIVIAARRTPAAIFFGAPYPVQLVYNAAAATAADRWSTTYATGNFRHTGTTYYVAVTGSDATGDGSSGNPWATLQKANDTAAPNSQIVVAAGRYAPVAITKNISFIGATPRTVRVGTFLTNADVANWGTPAGGSQTVQLATGFVHGFVDTTQFYEADCGGSPIVAQYSADGTHIAQRQALSPARAGIMFSYSAGVHSILGARDGRDLTGKFDTDILAWRNGAPAPLTVADGVTFYTSGIDYVGGKERAIGTMATHTGFMVAENCHFLGQGSDNGLTQTDGIDNTDQVLKIYGKLILKDCCVVGSNITYQDGIDYDSAGGAACGVHVNCYIGQAGNRGGDQGSTIHTGIGVMHVNTTFFDNSQDIGDLGPCISGLFNTKHKTGLQSIGCVLGAFNTSSEYHLSDVTFINSRTSPIDYQVDGSSHIFDYDGSTIGWRQDRSGVATVGSGTVHQWQGLSDLTADAVLAEIAVDKAYLFQDAGGTVPITASGQTVARINDASVPGQYYLVTLGTVTYTEGANNSLTFAGANGATLQLYGRAEPFGVCDIVVGLKTTDTSFDLIGSQNGSVFAFATPQHYGGAWTSVNPPYINKWGAMTPTTKVDNVGKTSHTLLSNAVKDGNPHVVSSESTDLSAAFWNGAALMNISYTGTTYAFTGELYRYIIGRRTGSSMLDTYKATARAASGAP